MEIMKCIGLMGVRLEKQVYMRPEVNSDRLEILLWSEISLRCKATSVSALTRLQAK